MTIPTAAELRTSIDVGRPATEDLTKVRAVLGEAAANVARERRNLPADHKETASEVRKNIKEATQMFDLQQLADEIEANLPMDSAQRKMRFGSERPAHAGVTGDRGQALRTIDGMRNVPDDGRQMLARAIDDAHNLGLEPELNALSRYVVVASDPHYARAVGKLFRDPTNGHREFTGEELRAYQAAQSYQRATMDTTSGSSGGFMLPTHLDPSIILTNAGVIDPMRLLARKALISTLQWNGVTSAGVSASWDAQNTQVSDDTPTLGAAPVPTYKGSAFVAGSIETAQDTTIGAEVGKLFTDAKLRLEGTAFTTGAGSTEPTGVITALDGSASEVAPTTGETYARADVFKLQEALPARWRANANWMLNLSMINATRNFPKLPSGTEVSLVDDSGPIPRVNGWLMYENSGMDGSINAAATADNFVALVGDFQQYLVVDRVGTTVEYIPHLFGANGRPTGTRGWYCYWRTGGAPLVLDAFRLLNVATTA